ncbi:hypothetical protein [Rhizobium leguminosarum]|uniref:hypothetical protein n=1 Tax=Rhizobium leguminosarum TaxID=384 RepID=UPI000517CBDB|nr:hypothetical protein [Rhizobium leguminosarum]NEH46108.1 hypothetical protein [Rhizobium leguminosarum]
MNKQQTARNDCAERDSEVTIEGLSSEISRLNVELTCASEAHEAVLAENRRMKDALRAAEEAFTAAGNKEMAVKMQQGVTGERPRPAGFKLPSSRRAA